MTFGENHVRQEVGEGLAGGPGVQCLTTKCSSAVTKCFGKACKKEASQAGLLKLCKGTYDACVSGAERGCRQKCTRGVPEGEVGDCINTCVITACRSNRLVAQCMLEKQAERMLACAKEGCVDSIKECMAKRCKLAGV